jgi:hypothetical protein
MWSKSCGHSLNPFSELSRESPQFAGNTLRIPFPDFNAATRCLSAMWEVS